MELHLHSHYDLHRMPDWSAAAVAGLAAGALLLVLELFWSTMIAGTNPWPTTRMIAAIVMGPEMLQGGTFSLAAVALALVIHFVLGTVLGMILGLIVAPFHLDSSAGLVLLTGAVFGALVYLVNFYLMTRWFSWFADARGLHTLVGNMLFGMCAGIAYRGLETETARR
ncbi:hypothetical protein [Cupriavidus sp. AU9028]|uniref:hypothetical protein n=1 Tax=Cupriavidus sp. AU9028 TaxID=2871157 RepID=UPI001C983A4C|nr:hypothetical protein [Cupriavidus sp. AU9028]MBY4896982.1 hypothetical protein [Cupriavidus sp. AU9028]